KLNLNAHGNIAGTGSIHVGNQGWGGPTEVNLASIFPPGSKDMVQLCLGLGASATGTTKRNVGKYGTNNMPSASSTSSIRFNAAGPTILPHSYAKVDLDGKDSSGAASSPWQSPGLAYQLWPTFPAAFGNANAAERAQHPLLYN